jgi:hypothetical protein
MITPLFDARRLPIRGTRQRRTNSEISPSCRANRRSLQSKQAEGDACAAGTAPKIRIVRHQRKFSDNSIGSLGNLSVLLTLPAAIAAF